MQPFRLLRFLGLLALVTSLLVSLFISPLPVQFSLPAMLSLGSSLCLLYPLYLPQKSPYLWSSHGLLLSFHFFPFKPHRFLFASGVTWVSLSHEKVNIEQPKERYDRSYNKFIQDHFNQFEGNLL